MSIISAARTLVLSHLKHRKRLLTVVFEAGNSTIR